MVGRFFLARPGDVHQQESDSIALLSGPPSCGKTSLLFQFAINSALECSSSNRKVVFICNRRRLENKPPYLYQGIDPSSDVFQRIKMKYADDDDGIKKYFAAFHLHDTFPAAVIVDDFGDFFQERSCQERYGNPRGRDLAMRWIPAIFTVKGDGTGSFLLKYNKYSGNGSSKSERIAKYSIAFQYLFLEEITEDGDDEQ
ncbi:hypothetical protein QQP08_008424 [Theobroma cacao]|nr:hypothetical protein QQP08_008424 [Theobroma cacao]